MESVLETVGEMTRSKTKFVCMLGPALRSVLACLNFSHGLNYSCHQEILDILSNTMNNTGIPCAVMLDTKGPEIRTGRIKRLPTPLTVLFLVTMIMISMSHKKLAEVVKPQNDILCSDGTITLKVLACDKELCLVRCRYENSAVLGERKNANIYGSGQTRDKVDILKWGIQNKIVMIALSL